MCENKDRPDLELERLVMGDEADGVRPSEGWLVREDVVRGAVELIKGLAKRLDESQTEHKITENALQGGAGMIVALKERNDQAREALAKSEMEAAELREQVERQARRISTLDSLILIHACTTCEGVAEALGIGNMMNPIPVLKERLAAEKQARSVLARSEMEAAKLRHQVDALTVHLEEEERMVRRLREVVLGAPKGVVLGDVSRGQRYLGTWQGPNLPEDWTVGTKLALVRLAPDGLGLAANTDDTNHTEGADA